MNMWDEFYCNKHFGEYEDKQITRKKGITRKVGTMTRRYSKAISVNNKIVKQN